MPPAMPGESSSRARKRSAQSEHANGHTWVNVRTVGISSIGPVVANKKAAETRGLSDGSYPGRISAESAVEAAREEARRATVGVQVHDVKDLLGRARVGEASRIDRSDVRCFLVPDTLIREGPGIYSIP